jgi:hypothetical protein
MQSRRNKKGREGEGREGEKKGGKEEGRNIFVSCRN